MASSSDDSSGSEPKGAKVLDITDRLPHVVLGDNPAGRVAVKLLAVLTNDDGEPHVHLAALMLTSFALQKMLKSVGNSEEQMNYIRERACEIAENMTIEVGVKET